MAAMLANTWMTTFEDKLRNMNKICSQKRETLRDQDVLTAQK